MDIKYDIFVSYRRDSFESANLIATRLRAEGYIVFFDVESLRGGKFNEQLYDVIDACKDFLLVLPPGALDRCNNHEDWVRKEVLRAMTGKKNIIPIMLAGFDWPQIMPDGMSDLSLYQSITTSSVEYFDLALRRLTERYLKSKPRHKKIIWRLCVVSCSILLLMSLSYGFLRLASIPLSDHIASEMIDHMVRLDLLGELMDKNYSDWNSFVSQYQNARNRLQQSNHIDDMKKKVENTFISLSETAPNDTLPKNYSFIQSVLLASRGIRTAEIENEPEFAGSYFSDFSSNLNVMYAILDSNDISSIMRKNIDSNAQLFKHLLAMGYYSYMEILSKMPKTSKKRYLDLASQFKSLPNDVPLTLSADEYLQKQKNENDICERIIMDLQGFSQNVAIQIDELENIVYDDNLNELEEMGDTELMIRQEKLEANKTILEQKKAQLEELDKEYVRVFEDLKSSCTIEENDDKWYKWGKIVKFASFMDLMVANRKDLERQGIHSTSSVTPDVAYAVLASMLNTFKEYHPESSKLVESAKIYYKEVSKGRRRINGVIVSAIKEGEEHPVFQEGDIILSMKGTPVANYDELRAAFKIEDKPKVSFLRFENGFLEERMVEDCGPTDILGFSELKQ